MNVGFVGLGRMGLPMARSLLRAGFRLTVYNRTRSRVELLTEDAPDLRVAQSPAEVMSGCEVVVTMLADGRAVEEVMLGDLGLLSTAVPGTVLIEMSTIGPQLARELASQAAARGSALLDAPVSGSVATAEAGALTALVGGDVSAFTRVLRVLRAMTAKQLFLGPSGAGAAMKLALNGLLAATNQALAEALVLAERNGIEPAAAYDAVGASVLGSPYVAYKRSAFLAPSDEPVAFTVALLQKDLDLLLSLGEHLGVPLTTASAVRDALGEAREVVGDDADLAAVATALRTRAQQTEAR